MNIKQIEIQLNWDNGTGAFEGQIELENDANLLICAEILARKSGYFTGDGVNEEKQFVEYHSNHPIIIYSIDIYDIETGDEVQFNRTEMEKLIKESIILN